MPHETSSPEVLVSLADLAGMAKVSRPAVSNWRRRHADFPTPVEENGAATLFRLSEVEQWMAQHGKTLSPRSIDQDVWTALNSVRGVAPLEDATEFGMAVLGAVSAEAHLGGSVDDGLRHLIKCDPSKLSSHLTAQASHVRSNGLPCTLAQLADPRWVDYAQYLQTLARLALEYGSPAVFEALLAANARGARAGGASTSPPSIALLLASLFSVRGTVLDFTCGLGGFLLAAGQAAKTSRVKLLGQDINTSASRLAGVRLLVHGFESSISQGDSLLDEAAPEVRADLIFAEPPFSLRWSPERDPDPSRWHFGTPPPSSADLAWIQLAINRLHPEGRAALVIPHGALFRGGQEKEIRRNLIKGGRLHAVISLPAALHPSTAIPTAVLVLGAPSDNAPRPLALIDASRAGKRRHTRNMLDDNAVNRIVATTTALLDGRDAHKDPDIDSITVSAERLLEGDCHLVPSQWTARALSSSALIERIQYDERVLRELGERSSRPRALVTSAGFADDTSDRVTRESTTVGELGSVITSWRIDPDLLGTGTTPVIRVQDVQRDFTVTPSTTIDLNLLPRPAELTQAGDVLVVTEGQIRAAVDYVGGATVSQRVQILRPRPGTIDPVALAALISSHAPEQSFGTTIQRVKLSSILLPSLDFALSCDLGAALRSLADRRRELVTALRTIEDLSEALTLGVGHRAVLFERAGSGDEQ